MKPKLWRWDYLVAFAAVCLVSSFMSASNTIAASNSFAYGDVFVAVSSGQVQWRDKDGNLKQTFVY